MHCMLVVYVSDQNQNRYKHSADARTGPGQLVRTVKGLTVPEGGIDGNFPRPRASPLVFKRGAV